MTRNEAVFLWIAIGMAGGFLLVLAVSRFVFRSTAQLSALRALAISGPSVPFVGTPVLGLLYPTEAALAIAAGGLVINLLLVPLALIFLAGGGPAAPGSAPPGPLKVAAQSVMKAVRQPVVWAPILAFVLLLLGLDMPHMLAGSFALLGHATGGVALFAVGIVLFSQKVTVSLPVILNVICKNFVLPAAVLAAMIWLAVPSPERGLVAVTLAIPTTSVAVIFAVEHKVGEQEMASTLFWSTILSVLTMGGFIWYTG